jgi:hypothetical protein
MFAVCVQITFMGVKQDTRDAATIFEVMVNTIYLKGRDEYSGHGRTTIDDYRHAVAPPGPTKALSKLACRDEY